MSLRAKLTWAFISVAFIILVLAFSGLNYGLYSAMNMHTGSMMLHDRMMSGEVVLGTALRFSLISGLAALVAAVGAGYFTAERITRSLRHLRDTARVIGLRDLSRRVPVAGTDEIADLARAFNRMGERLEGEERARRQLLADVAHELRHPLAVLKGRLDLMQDGKVELDQETLLPLQDEVIRLTRLVGDLQDLSLAEVGGLSLRVGGVDLSGLLQGLLANLSPVAEERQLRLVDEISPGLPELRADPDRLRQVFLNLVANALHYCEVGGSVTVQARRAGNEVVVMVSDTGPGIAPEDLPHIFDRFYRADKSRSRGTGGSGLGLAIVRSLVELHRGRVTVTSDLGVGTTFTVKLPVPE